MNVKQLIEYLKACDPNSVILVASDEEGNAYHELGKITISPCVPQGYEYELTDDENDQPAIVIYP